MKPLSQLEIQSLAQQLQLFKGWYLQDNVGNDDNLGLQLYGGKKGWIWIEIKQPAPILVPLEQLPERFRKRPKPIHQFIASHGRGLPLTSIDVREDLGRVVELEFNSGQKTLKIQISLIPHFANVEVWTFVPGQEHKTTKRIHWFKPKQLPQSKASEPASAPITNSARDVDAIIQDWKNSSSATAIKQSPVAQVQKRIDKLNKVVHQIQSEPNEGDIQHWHRLGEYLKIYGFDKLSEVELKRLKTRHLATEIDYCFEMARKQLAKSAGRQERLAELQGQVARLEEALAQPDDKSIFKILNAELDQKNLRTANNSKSKNAPVAKYRTHVSAQGFEIRIGRSGEENLKLLRNSASWFLWLHVRDQTGSFGIIPREKKQSVPPADLKELAVHLVRSSLPQKQRSMARGRYEILCTECRFIQPVKGAKVGLVTYRNESVFTVDL